MTNQIYYFLCSYPLGNGSIVLPGNWGRMLKNYQIGSNLFLITREAIFEEVRLKNFPSKPSRLDSIFLCEDKQAIEIFKNETGRRFDITYEVELIDQTQPFHRGSWKMPLTNDHSIFHVYELAHAYWEKPTSADTEIVTTSPIKIIQQVQ